MSRLFRRYLELLEESLDPAGRVSWPVARDKVTTPPWGVGEALVESPMLPPGCKKTEALVLELWRTFFPGQTVGLDSDFFQLGGHSLMGMRLIAALEKFFDREIPLNAIFDAPTPRKLTAVLEKKTAVPRFSLSRLNHTNGKTPFIFMHGWGGDAFCFFNAAQVLEGRLPVMGLNADPRHGARITSLPALARDYARHIDEKLELPAYALGGYSIGGVIAWATALALQERGKQIAMLAMFDTRPHVVPLWTNLKAHRHWLRHRLRHHLDRLRKLPLSRVWRELPRQFRAATTTLGGGATIAPEVDMAERPDAFQTDEPYAPITQSWTPEPYRGDLDLFWSYSTLIDLTMAWKPWIHGAIRPHRIEGEHLEIMAPAHVQGFADALERAYARRLEVN